MAGPAPRCQAPGCRNSLRGKPHGTKTCCQSCRDKLYRARKRAREAASARASLPPQQQAISEVVTHRAKDAAHEVLKEELRPIIVEHLTQDVLDGLGALVKLTPRAVELLGQDLEASDETIRQRAYTLLLKYTVGNQAVAPATPEQQPAPMQVVFEMPRPGDPQAGPAVTAQAEEVRDCVECEATKSASQFIGSSQRCIDCQQRLEDMVAARFA